MWFIIVILLGAALFFFVRNHTANHADLGPLADEVVSVVNAFLETSRNFYYLDENFNGAISIMPGTGTPGPFLITLMRSGFLSSLYDRSPKFLVNNPEKRKSYDQFLERFGACFVPGENAYICRTRCTVGGSKGQREKIKQYLLQQIRTRCPLADVRGEIIYTKGVDPN